MWRFPAAAESRLLRLLVGCRFQNAPSDTCQSYARNGLPFAACRSALEQRHRQIKSSPFTLVNRAVTESTDRSVEIDALKKRPVALHVGQHLQSLWNGKPQLKVIGLRMLVPEAALQHDPEGQVIAAAINAHLPLMVRVFSCQLVNPSFEPRRYCQQRSYRFFLPLAVLGADLDGPADLTQEGKRRLQAFQTAMQQYAGRHPFHNFAGRRSQYMRSRPAGAPDRDAAAGMEVGLDPTSNSFIMGDSHSGSGGAMLGTVSSHAAGFADTLASHEAHEAAAEAGTTGSQQPPTPGSPWVQDVHFDMVPDAGDGVAAAFYRTVTMCSASGPLRLQPGGVPCLRLEVVADSFMLHQIRHMVGAAVAVARGVLPAELLSAALCPAVRVSVPLAPPHTLVLAAADFSPFYREGDGESSSVLRLTGEHLQLGRQGTQQQAAFEEHVLLPALNPLLGHPDWSTWSASLERFCYPEDSVQRVVQQHGRWQAERQTVALARAAARGEAPPAPPTPTLPAALLAALSKARMQVVRVICAQDVEGSERMISCTLDAGGGRQLQALLGIRPHCTAQELQGRLCAAVTNMRAARLAGRVSNAMLLAAVAEGQEAGDQVERRVCLLSVPEGCEAGDGITVVGAAAPSTWPQQLNPIAWHRVSAHLTASAGTVTCAERPLTTAHGPLTVPQDFPTQARVEG